MGLPPEVHISDSSRTIFFKCGLYAVVYLPFQVTEHNFNGEHRPLRVRKRLRFSMCFLHQLSKVRPAQPPDLKVWSGDQNKLTMIQVKTCTPPGLSQVLKACGNPESIEGAGGWDFQPSFHHLYVVLMNQRDLR